tara:strand:- start:155 stop:274 length:120 start_codon:yes stop_codon:yes gene_type:complete
MVVLVAPLEVLVLPLLLVVLGEWLLLFLVVQFLAPVSLI